MTMIQFHILRNYAASNLNRDEIGAPKTAYFAGSQRGRISSQCLKRAWRNSEAIKNLGSFGMRTKYLPEIIADRIKECADEGTYRFAVKNKGLFADLGKNGKEKGNEEEVSKESENASGEGTTAQLMFFSKEDIDVCVKAVLDADKDTKKLKEAIGLLKDGAKLRPITLDIALFGRMITDDKFADVDASLQVAHALSSNKVNMESDYFTAVDDLSSTFREDAGAGHLGDCDFNSCCYYEYASLDVDQLRKNLRNSPEALSKLPLLLSALIEAMAYSSPTGKQNSFAAHQLPSVICLEKKSRKIPVSYANAFEEPVTHSYSAESARRLAAEINKMDTKYDTGLEERLWFDINGAAAPAKGTQIASLKELIDLTASWLQ